MACRARSPRRKVGRSRPPLPCWLTGWVQVSGDGGRPSSACLAAGAGITTLYSDGGSKTLLRDGASSVLVVAQAVEGSIACTAWYPAGHVFSMAERSRAGAAGPAAGAQADAVQVKDADCSAESEKAERAQQAVIAAAPRCRPRSWPCRNVHLPSGNRGGFRGFLLRLRRAAGRWLGARQ